MAISEQEIASRPQIRVIRALCKYYVFGYHRMKVHTVCTLPAVGPAILVSNHISGVDPALLQAVSPKRLIAWMMAKEYYDMGSLRWFYKALECIPVERSGRDLAATRMALRTLEDGRILGIFPEGRIAKSGEVLPFQGGVALMAIKSGAPVIPVFLEGTMRNMEMVEAFLTPAQVEVAWGPELQFDRSDSSREGLERAAVKMRQAVEALRDRYSELRPRGLSRGRK
jgi:1-acyl-sn-glycerol-3-phosphate acyltransferase